MNCSYEWSGFFSSPKPADLSGYKVNRAPWKRDPSFLFNCHFPKPNQSRREKTTWGLYSRKWKNNPVITDQGLGFSDIIWDLGLPMKLQNRLYELRNQHSYNKFNNLAVLELCLLNAD